MNINNIIGIHDVKVDENKEINEKMIDLYLKYTKLFIIYVGRYVYI